MKLVVSHSSRPKPGESANGDAFVTRRHGERHLFAVVDALGHGPDAAVVARRACKHHGEIDLDCGLRDIMTGLHAALRNTRGAAAMVCLLQSSSLEACGVGNVELRVQGSNVPVMLSPGVLGSSVRQFRVFGGKVGPGTRLVLFSDGVSSRFTLDGIRLLSPEDACKQIITQHAHAHDDATVAVVDCAG